MTMYVIKLGTDGPYWHEKRGWIADKYAATRFTADAGQARMKTLNPSATGNSVVADAIKALVKLGMKPELAKRRINRALDTGLFTDVADLITAAFQQP